MTVTAQMFDTHPRANDIANRDAPGLYRRVPRVRPGLYDLRRRLSQRGDGRRSDHLHPSEPGLRRPLRHHRALSRHTGTDTTVLRAALEAPVRRMRR